MQIINKITEMSLIIRDIHIKNKKIGFVPTMGFLHQGHLSLFDKAKECADVSIASIFVNPTQFGPNEDFNKYPRNVENDIKLAEEHNVDYLFIPEVNEIYPNKFYTSISITEIIDKFEGKLRPGHFNGVALIVAKLFNIIQPDYVIFGQKDYQQILVISNLIKDLNFNIELIISSTIRAESGLALSSRNTYLSAEELAIAPILYNTLELAKNAIINGERERKKINILMHQNLRSVSAIKIDYASIAIAEDLSEPDIFSTNDTAILLLAVYLGKTRLIDNSFITFP